MFKIKYPNDTIGHYRIKADNFDQALVDLSDRIQSETKIELDWWGHNGVTHQPEERVPGITRPVVKTFKIGREKTIPGIFECVKRVYNEWRS